MTTRHPVVLIGGPYDRIKANLSREPERIEINGRTYERIDDPDTGRSLSAYAYREGLT